MTKGGDSGATGDGPARGTDTGNPTVLASDPSNPPKVVQRDAPATDRAGLSDTAAIDPSFEATVAEPLSPSRTMMAPDVLRGERIGRLLVLRMIGAGGMGVVYAAYDPDLDRKVALKVITQQRTQSGDAQTRLLREAQALAKLNHPNVVTVHDVGIHDEQVWLAMEFVAGLTMTDWLGNKKQTWREILEVTLQAAQGVAAAHRAGLLHRDLKPDNIMIGDDGRVRVMDFGLARTGTEEPPPVLSTSTQNVLSVDLTAAGTVMGTPAYMAPEQFLGLVADERTDVYSLCATLWEGLFGQRAHRGKTFEDLAVAVKLGRLTPPPAGSGVPGWLTRVVERGLKVGRDDRWPSVDELIAALQNDPTRARVGLGVAAAVGLGIASWFGVAHLQRQRTIDACAAAGRRVDASWNEEARSRLRGRLLSAGVGYADSTAATVVPLLDEYARGWSDARAALCRARALEAPRDAALDEAALACLGEHYERFSSLVDLLSQEGPEDAPQSLTQGAIDAVGRLPRIATCADETRLRTRSPLPEDASSRAEIRRLRALLARSHAAADAGRYADAMALAVEAQADADALGWDPLRAAIEHHRGYLHGQLGEYEQAEAVTEAAYFRAAAAGEDEVYANAAGTLANIVAQRARPVEGLRWGQQATVLLDRAGAPEDDPRRGAVLINIGDAYGKQGDFDKALEHLTRAAALLERALGPNHPDVADALNNIGNTHYAQGAYDKALEVLARALLLRESTLGPNHPRVASTLASIGNIHFRKGALERATEYFERSKNVMEKALGPNHPNLARPLANLGIMHSQRGDPDRALGHYARALTILEASLGPDHPDLGAVLINMADARAAKGEHTEAIELYLRTITIREKALGADHPSVAGPHNNLASLHADRGELESALEHYQRALEIWEAKLGPEHPDVGHPLNGLGSVYMSLGSFEKALAHYERAATVWDKGFGPEHEMTATMHSNAGNARLMLGQLDAAIELYRKALAIHEKQSDVSTNNIASALTGLGSALIGQGAPERARPHLERALALREGKAAKDTTGLGSTRFALARALWPVPEQRPRARRLAEQAQRDLEKPSRWSMATTAGVTAWLAKHPLP